MIGTKLTQTEANRNRTPYAAKTMNSLALWPHASRGTKWNQVEPNQEPSAKRYKNCDIENIAVSGTKWNHARNQAFLFDSPMDFVKK